MKDLLNSTTMYNQLRYGMLLLLCSCFAAIRPLSAETVVVYVFNNQFSINPPGGPVTPAVITAGDHILWQHVQGGHTTTSVMASAEQWDSPITSSNPTYMRQFNVPGTYWYYCIPHGSDNMDGTASGMASTITVLQAGSGACCLPDGMCITTNEGSCLAQGGDFSGTGTSCANTTCTSSAVVVANKDNILYQSATGTISNALGNHIYAGNNNSGIRRGILSFDVSSIPQNAVIESVELRMWCNSNSGAAFPVTLHKVLQSWTEGASQAGGNEGNGATALEGDVTWLHRVYNTQFWTTPGGTFDATPVASASVNAQNAFFYWSSEALIEAVEHWIHMPGMNHGLMMRGDEASTANTKRFSSRHVGTPEQRPTLLITYFVPPTGACCLQDGTCTDYTEMQCSMEGGNFQGAGTSCTTVSCAPVLTPYLDALPLPGVAMPATGQAGGAAHYEIYVTEQFQTLHSQLPPTRVWGYNGTYPGPTIEAFKDQLVTVQWHNDLRVFETGELRNTHALPVDTCLHGPHITGSVPVVVTHLHGGKVDPISDGQPELSFPPGQSSEVYQYPNIQPAGTLWYHDHALGITRLNVMMGMAGLYNLRDNEELALNLPSGEFEVPLVIQDKSFNPDGSLRYPEMHEDHFFGEVLMVNGKVWPYLEVKQGKYRFRVVNGSNSRTYTIALSNGAHFLQIGSELGLLDAPVMLQELTIHPGERYDLVVDFSTYAPGTEIILTNSAPAPFPGFPGVGVVPNIMKFTVLGAQGFTAAVPDTLVSLPPMEPELAVIERVFELLTIPPHDCGEHSHGSPVWTINGLMWDDITEFPVLNTYEIWTWHNQSGMSHPMHMHLVAFRVLHRQALDDATGQPVGPLLDPEPHEKGWKDTAHSPPGYRTSVLAQFTGFTGTFPYHCHILEHEDHEMMRQFTVIEAVVGCTDSLSCNYNPEATIDDGSCTYPGCSDPASCNYDPAAGCDDGSCEYLSCADCNGEPFGSAYFDACDNCVGGTTGLEPCEADCEGIFGGTALPGSACTTGENLQGVYSADCICEALPCSANGGTLQAPANRSFCVGTGSPASINVTAVGAAGTFQRWGLINSTGDVVATRASNSLFNLDIYPAGNYTIRYMRYESDVNVAAITNIADIANLEGCYGLASNPIQLFLRQEPNAGVLSAISPLTVCTNEGPSSVIQVGLTGFQGENLRYAVVSQDLGNQLILQNAGTTTGTTFNLDGWAAGTYRAAALAYQAGVSLAGVQFASDLQGCYNLSNLVAFQLVDCAASTLFNQPNPTAGINTVLFVLPQNGWASLELYDMSGRLVHTLFSQFAEADLEYRFDFDGSQLPNGIYLYRLITQEEVLTDKLVIAR